MKLKTFVARNPQEALAQVKRELGPEAVILSIQSQRPQPLGSALPASRQVEVTAAVAQEASLDEVYFQGWSGDFSEPFPSSRYLQEEFQELKALIRQWLWDQGPPPWLAHHPDLTRLFQTLVRIGIHEQIIRRWLEKVRGQLADSKTEGRGNFRELALRQLLNELTVVDLWKTLAGGPRRWVFLGSTGVGKTTTVVKLAIQADFVRKKQVGLISLDTERPGSHDQLAAYARISGLPLALVQTRSELAETLDKMEHLDLVLIDTPGRNPCDPALPGDLSRLFGGLPVLDHHLVVSATATETNLADALRGFYSESLASCIITKTDEARDIVGAFNQLCGRRIPLSFLSTGQRIPEDLEPASRRRLVQLLLSRHFSQKGPR